MNGDQFDPRAYITKRLTGERRLIPREDMTGADEFLEAMQSRFELPPEVRFQGWQESDDEHPVGNGRPGYRVIYKTLRTVPTGPVAVESPNCRVSLMNGTVSWGEPRFGRALPWRRPNRYLIPDWGRVYYNPLRYVRSEDNTVHMEAHQETSAPMNYVEILYVLNDDVASKDHYGKLSAAQAAVAPLLASLDLTFGARLLGVRITEEIGEVFDDWHWNRRLDGPTVALEAQADLAFIEAQAGLGQIRAIFEANAGRSLEHRSRLRIASQWYWRADAETDPVQKFIAFWLVIEALEMDGPNIAPVKQVVQSLTGDDSVPVAAAIGRLHGLRSRLVHGKQDAVSSVQLGAVEAVSLALLERHLLGVLTDDRKSALRQAVQDASSAIFSG